ncbi:MAG TPA: hypothetical protein DDZ11_09625 [Lentisphaeria bacterium]|nr:hypothetical protein [Lentisphaeria bacterium]
MLLHFDRVFSEAVSGHRAIACGTGICSGSISNISSRKCSPSSSVCAALDLFPPGETADANRILWLSSINLYVRFKNAKEKRQKN